MKESSLSSRGIYYRTNEFQPERQTLVFVHGLSGSSSAWLPYEKELESSFNILSFDLRGHGKSKKTQLYEKYRIESFAEDLYDLVEHLRIEKCILVGHSLGCSVVLSFLQNYQDKVSKVVFISPNFSIGKTLGAKLSAPLLSMVVLLGERLPFYERTGRHLDYSWYPRMGDWNILRIITDVLNTGPRIYLYTIKQSYDFDAESFLESIRIPALIIHGEKDTIFPVRHGVLMARRIKGAKLIILEKANHFPVFNNRKEVLEEIKNFVI